MDVSQYLEIFIDETSEHLQNLSDCIMELEKDPENMDTINEIFRAAHSLKGMAGTMGFKRMQRLTHDMENVFQEVRSEKVKVTSSMIDLLFKCLDAIEGYLGNVKASSDEGTEDNELIIRELNDFIAAEDTRVSLKLLNHLELKKSLVSYHEHNKAESGEKILARLLAGETCALVTDAGSPAISDPGEDLVRLCAEHGVTVCAIPGPCALVTALSISGLPTGRFTFEGFLSVNKKSRQEHLTGLKDETRTMIFYEAPHKLLATLQDLSAAFGAERKISLCRELTKLHEEVRRTTLGEAAAYYAENPPRGEFVLVVAGAEEPAEEEGARPSEVEPEEEVVARPSLFADPQYTDYQRMNAGDESDDDLPAEPVRPSQSFEPAESAESAEPAAPAKPAEPARPAEPAKPAKPAEPVETASAATEEKQEEENVLRCGGEKAA